MMDFWRLLKYYHEFNERVNEKKVGNDGEYLENWRKMF